MIRTILLTTLSVSPLMACIGGTNSVGCCNPTTSPCPSSVPSCSGSRYPFVAPPSTYTVAGGSYASPLAGSPSNNGPINGVYGGSIDSYSPSHDAPIEVVAPAQQQGSYNTGPVETVVAPTSVPAPTFNNAPIIENAHEQVHIGQQYSAPVDTVHVQQQVQPHQYAPVEAIAPKQQVHTEVPISYPAPQEVAPVQVHVQTAQSNYQQATADAGSYPIH